MSTATRYLRRLHPSTRSLRPLGALTVPARRLQSNIYLGRRALCVSTHRLAVPSTVSPSTTGSPSDLASAQLSDQKYHELADEYLENVCTKYEDIQDMREDVDVEFASGVLTIKFGRIGTYVINKQPPNKQIWLSSPISGPKRYDFVVDKSMMEGGNWIYLRDGSTMDGLLLSEMGVDVKA
ncbi:hypothetical protein BROUX41_001016 [Berkeleyomyces rouxiae]|uniref:uncharacterized protein n=1 Tax=Berkeleyomyces rouxiae TaxID=2035830 RepID=UPI003B7F88F5